MIKINSLELENIKRIKAVVLTPQPNGLTVIGGNNGQGKTSVLDAIAWCLGGDKYRPSEPQREGSVTSPALRVTLSNGFIVERSGKNSALKVIDPNGGKGGQQLLNEFVSQFAIDLPKFMQGSSKDKANTLLQIIGVGDELYRLERAEQELYNRRHTLGQIADQKAKFAAEMAEYPEAPEQPISVMELIQKQQDILAKNGENQRKRAQRDSLIAANMQLESKIQSAQRELAKLMLEQEQVKADLEIAEKTVQELHDESTAEIEASINDIETINVKIRANLDKAKACEDAEKFREEYKELTAQLDDTRKAKADLLNGAELPLDGLSVDNGELTYNGKKWDCMSGAEQLKVSTAIVRKLNPQCGFVLLDKLEQMDIATLSAFGAWLEKEGLQAIATRVSTGGECSVIIEDGCNIQPTDIKPKWQEGVF